MARRNRFTSPTLEITIGQEQIDRAVRSASGGCLIADAIKEQYPHLRNVTVDMATIRATDSKRGQRYTYLTTATAQEVLLYFDQGWPNPADHLTIKGAVQITPVTRGGNRSQAPERRAARREELQARQSAGETLTPREKTALTRLTRNPDRPKSPGPAEVSASRSRPVVHGGTPRIHGAANPNLLAGRDRHYGAKLARPGVAFSEAVDKAVAERLAAGPPS